MAKERFDFSKWVMEDYPPLEIEFSLEHRENVFGVHEEGAVIIYLPSFNYSSMDLNIQKIIECIWHESMHNAINKCAGEVIGWQKQDWAINKVLRKCRE